MCAENLTLQEEKILSGYVRFSSVSDKWYFEPFYEVKQFDFKETKATPKCFFVMFIAASQTS